MTREKIILLSSIFLAGTLGIVFLVPTEASGAIPSLLLGWLVLVMFIHEGLK